MIYQCSLLQCTEIHRSTPPARAPNLHRGRVPNQAPAPKRQCTAARLGERLGEQL